MILRVYTVLDKAVQAFMPPMLFRSEGEAVRAFMEAVIQEGTQFNKHKADYVFCYCGTFNDATGMFFSESPVPIAEAANIVNAMEMKDS
ncbi:MAG: nonstructural protein [Microvirus sp.]|nr:MAG: nonstructural protein [Microvirus sp.]